MAKREKVILHVLAALLIMAVGFFGGHLFSAESTNEIVPTPTVPPFILTGERNQCGPFDFWQPWVAVVANENRCLIIATESVAGIAWWGYPFSPDILVSSIYDNSTIFTNDTWYCDRRMVADGQLATICVENPQVIAAEELRSAIFVRE